MQLKCKPDLLAKSKAQEMMICVDLKSSIEPDLEGFMKQSSNLGYYRQAAHYLDGCTAHCNLPTTALYIVVGKEVPHDVHVYRPKDEYIALGHYENTTTLAALDKSIKLNEWFAENQNEIQDLPLAPWKRRKSE